ncbi:MAG: helix-turn-helix domain-containing protein [Dehalococcoidia bacterium]|nr:helix-turn-helix domain-containing protein [Dehalococcoidia bacterium]
MEKRTIGSFIATMRKSKGLTQQDLADKLFVSNKTVSKWECDESNPDLSMLPVIAEILGVSCDEILTGNRLLGASGDKTEQKTEKQIAHIAGTIVTKFKNRCLVAGLLTLFGLIVLFAVSYAFYKPIIGFALNLMFLATSVVLMVMQFNSTKDSFMDNDVLIGGEVITKAKGRLNQYLFVSICLNFASLVLSIPFILVKSAYYVNSVITIRTYVSYLPLLASIIALISFIAFVVLREKDTDKIKKVFEKVLKPYCLTMDAIYVVLVLVGGALLAWAQLQGTRLYMNVFGFIAVGTFLLSCLLILATPIVFVLREKRALHKKLNIVTGIRNVLLSVAVFSALSGIQAYGVYISNGGNQQFLHNTYTYMTIFLMYAILFALLSVAIWLPAKYFLVRNL